MCNSALRLVRPLSLDHLGDLLKLVPLSLHLHHEPRPFDRLIRPAGPNPVFAVREQRGLGQQPTEDPQAERLALQPGDGDQILVGGKTGRHGLSVHGR